MRLRTKLLFAFLASPAFLFLETLRASSELRAVGRDLDDLGRYTQNEDLRNQVIVELHRREPAMQRVGQLRNFANSRGHLRYAALCSP